jgi:hypothetical protein
MSLPKKITKEIFMQFNVQTPPEPAARRSAKEEIGQGLNRIRAHYAGKEGEARLYKLAHRSLNWSVKWAVIGAGLVCVEAVILSALFATTTDWKLLADVLHRATAEGINDWLHHELLPLLCFSFGKLWAARVLADILAVGFSRAWPSGLFEERVEPAELNKTAP